MGGTKSPASRWCLLRDDFRVKEAVKSRMKEKKIGVREMGRIINIDPVRISRYLKYRHASSSPSITQHQLMAICQKLDIYVTLSIKIE